MANETIKALLMILLLGSLVGATYVAGDMGPLDVSRPSDGGCLVYDGIARSRIAARCPKARSVSAPIPPVSARTA